jgi:hypothetical protein
MTDQERLRLLERQLRQSIGELAPFCHLILACLIALLAERTVNLAWIAQTLPSDALPESNRKRIQRFLDDRRVTSCAFAKVLAAFLPKTPWILALDRTNWFFGKTALNLLVLAVLLPTKTGHVALPLLWMPLERDGASDTDLRKRLLAQFLDLFGCQKIHYLTGDREFIGADWIAFLIKEQIPFRLRLRKDDLVTDPDGCVWEVAALFARRQSPCRKKPYLLWGSFVYLGGKRLTGADNFLVVASNEAGSLLEDYRRRWKIECLFQGLKERGFDLEGTRVTQGHRLSALLGLLSLAYLWCVNAGQSLPESVCSATGRLRKSVFRCGFEVVHRVAVGLVKQADAWQWEHALRCWRPCKC